jgi:phage-related protein
MNFAISPTMLAQKQGSQFGHSKLGEAPPDSKPMAIVGRGVQEIRIRTTDAYRIFYIAKFSEAIYILHAFQKKSQKTARSNIELGQQRYKQLLQERQQETDRND